MSDAEIKYTFGQRKDSYHEWCKGYELYLNSSATGSPSETGTWVAKGTATDTDILPQIPIIRKTL